MPSPLQKTGNGFCRAEACFFAHKFLTANYNLRKKRVFMNTLVIVLIAVVVLGLGYVLYGRHIAKKWGIDPKAETPAVKYNDGKDYVPLFLFQPFLLPGPLMPIHQYKLHQHPLHIQEYCLNT